MTTIEKEIFDHKMRLIDEEEALEKYKGLGNKSNIALFEHAVSFRKSRIAALKAQIETKVGAA